MAGFSTHSFSFMCESLKVKQTTELKRTVHEVTQDHHSFNSAGYDYDSRTQRFLQRLESNARVEAR